MGKSSFAGMISFPFVCVLSVEICDVISPDVETSVTQNFACRLQLPFLLPVGNFIVIGVS